MGTGIALPGTHPASPSPTTPGTPSPYRTPEHQVRYGGAVTYGGVNSAVGLKSVGQLSLSVQISGFHKMTEVYNLVEIRRINNHFHIPGNE